MLMIASFSTSSTIPNLLFCIHFPDLIKNMKNCNRSPWNELSPFLICGCNFSCNWSNFRKMFIHEQNIIQMNLGKKLTEFIRFICVDLSNKQSTHYGSLIVWVLLLISVGTLKQWVIDYNSPATTKSDSIKYIQEIILYTLTKYLHTVQQLIR